MDMSKSTGPLTDDTTLLLKFISLDEDVGHYNCPIPEPCEKPAAANSAPEDIKCVVIGGPKDKCVNVIKISPCDGHITQDDSLIPAGQSEENHDHLLSAVPPTPSDMPLVTIACPIEHDKMDSPTYSHVPLHYVTPAKLYPVPNVIKTRIQRGRQSKSEVLTSSPYKDKLAASKQKKKRVKSTEEKLTEAKTKKTVKKLTDEKPTTANKTENVVKPNQDKVVTVNKKRFQKPTEERLDWDNKKKKTLKVTGWKVKLRKRKSEPPISHLLRNVMIVLMTQIMIHGIA